MPVRKHRTEITYVIPVAEVLALLGITAEPGAEFRVSITDPGETLELSVLEYEPVIT